MKPDDAFLRDLGKSRADVIRFAKQISDNGIHAEASPQQTRPSAADRMQYGDSGDLMICGRVEHKVRELYFCDRESYPYDTIIVDEKYKVDRATDAPLAYVIENRDNTCAAVIYGYTRPLWRVERRWDKKAKRYGNYYEIHKDHARFCRPEEAFYVAPAESQPSCAAGEKE